MGFLSSADVIECSASDLVGQYVGHTGPKTRKLFEKALGKVLFIDEAYRLSQGQFAQEAMDEIVDIMTKEKFMNKLVIIIAGYDGEMNKLLGVNPGLASRFSEEIHFHNMTPDQCLALLDKDLRKDNIVVAEMTDPNSADYQEMQAIISRMSILSSWGNARDIKTLGKRMFQQAFANASNGGPATLVVAEAKDIMQSMFKEQRERLGVPSSRVASSPPPPMASFSGPPSPPPPTASSSSSQSSKPPPPPPPPPSSSSNTPKPPPQRPSSSASVGSQPPRAQTPSKEQRPKQRGRHAAPKQPAAARQPTQPKPNLSEGRPDASRIPPSTLDDQRDPGVSDDVWNQLQADKLAAEEQKRRDKEDESRLQREVNKARDVERQAAKLRAEVLEKINQQAAADKAMQEGLERQLEMDRKRAAGVRAAREQALAELRERQQLADKAMEEKLQREVEAARRREAEVRAAREQALAELKQQQQAADKAMREMRELEAARRREAEVKAARERAQAELKQKQQENAQRQKKEEEIRRKLQRSGCCPRGYHWVRQLGGWRCRGGSHFVTDAQLGQI